MSFDKDPPPPYPYLTPTQSLVANVYSSSINDYLPWSIVNLFFGWGFLGIIPLVFSIICRNEKSVNNLNQARTMSTLALGFNIFITIIGVIGWIAFIMFASSYIATLHFFT